jgi:hypothetical protein
MRTALTCALGLCIAAVLGGCSSDNGGSGFSTGLPKSESLGGLNGSDAQKVCDAFQNFSGSVIPKSSECKLVGISAATYAAFTGTATDADLQKACSDAVTKCEQNPPQTSHVDAGAMQCTPPSSNCKATVGDLEACMNDVKTAASQAYANVPDCSSLKASEFKTTDGGLPSSTFIPHYTPPASCQSFAQKCPELPIAGAIGGGTNSVGARAN